ncbi:MAG: hypothetical protein P4L40_15160 [Terracidiphilus sp.]|nr:hypothetical protein [Terracidiphilus sp.]
MASAFALALLGVCVALAAAVDTTLLYEWVTVEYDWSAADRAAAIASGAFIPENNAITGGST